MEDEPADKPNELYILLKLKTFSPSVKTSQICRAKIISFKVLSMSTLSTPSS